MKNPLVIHPILWAFFPVLFLYANNVIQTGVKQVLIPLAFSLGLTLLLWLLFGLLIKDRVKAGLAASIFVLLFFTYGRLYSQFESWDIFVPGHAYLLPGILLVFGYGVYFLRRSRRDLKTTTMVLNIAAAVLIAINVFTIVSHQITSAQVSLPQINGKEPDRKSTRLNSSHSQQSRMPSSA